MVLPYYKKRRLKLIWDKFNLLIILYAIFFLIWLWIALKYPWWLKVISPMKIPRTFFEGWFSAFSEDLLFFGLGFLGLLISTNFLIHESFDTKIFALGNGKSMTKEIEIHLRDRVEELLTYNRKYETKIEIMKEDRKSQHIYLHVHMKCQVANLSERDEIPAYIKTFIEPGPCVQGSYGAVYHHSVTYKIPKRFKKKSSLYNQTEFILKRGHTLNLENQNYDFSKSYYLPGDGKAEWELAFGVWIPFGKNIANIQDNWFFNSFQGYTRNFKLILINSLSKSVNFNYTYPDRITGKNIDINVANQQINSGQQKEIAKNLTFNRFDKLKVYFY